MNNILVNYYFTSPSEDCDEWRMTTPNEVWENVFMTKFIYGTKSTDLYYHSMNALINSSGVGNI